VIRVTAAGAESGHDKSGGEYVTRLENRMVNQAAKKRILVIDDDERVLISLECLLENEGYETTTVWSAQEGLEMLRTKPFDLVLLDDYMHGVPIEHIFEEIQKMEIQPPIILTESSSLPEARKHFIQLGAVAVVNKWAPCEESAEEVRKQLAKAELEALSV
jgi:CheY-like chemotaxis protein